MFEVSDESFERDVLQSDRPVVVDFWAPWCGPCKTVTSILEQLEREHDGGVVFATVNIDDHADNAARFGVLSIPTAILFEDGEPRETVIGARPRSYYERVWAPWLTSDG